MQKWQWLFAFLIAGILLGQDTSAPSTSTSPLRLAFWNIQWFPGRHPSASPKEEEKQIASVQEDMRAINPDIIGMEEVRDFAKATLAVASLPGFKVDVISNFPPREGQDIGQQIAIASRFAPMSAWVEKWQTAGALVPPRGFAFAAYQLGPRHLLLVYAMHLKSNRGQIAEDIAIREESARQLRAHMSAMNDAYGKLGSLSWVVGGDFNTAPDDRRFARDRDANRFDEQEDRDECVPVAAQQVAENIGHRVGRSLDHR